MRRKTNEQFKKEVYYLVGDEYTFLDTYVNTKTKIKVKHSKCGNIYEVRPNDFLRGSRCPYCAGIIKKTDTQFKQEAYDLVGNDYVFLESYQGALTKIKVKHNKCGSIYKVKPSDFLQGHYCPYCAGNLKKTDTYFREEVYDLVGNEYTFLDYYVNAHTKLRVKHNKCGSIYKVQPSNFLNGSQCPYCSGKIKKTDAQFRKEVYDLVGNEYIFLDSYVNTMTKLRVQHTKCGHIYKVVPNNFIRGSRCPCCSVNTGKTDARFKKEVFDLVGNEYTFLDPYVNNHTKLRVKHNKCGNIYEVKPTDFLDHQTRCPYCNSPKGETIIGKILDILNINYEAQKTFDDLRDTQPLSYDFFIPSQSILIEYQGLQHYQSIDYFGGEKRFEYQQKHDKMKAEYAKANGYKLITIPYTEDTFSKIKKYLIKNGLRYYYGITNPS